MAEALPNLGERLRRRDVLQDLIAHNPRTHQLRDRAEELRAQLKDYDGMTPKLRGLLKSFGFVISDDGLHYRAKYHGDDRYDATFSRTPSDYRSGRNLAAQIVRDML